MILPIYAFSCANAVPHHRDFVIKILIESRYLSYASRHIHIHNGYASAMQFACLGCSCRLVSHACNFAYHIAPYLLPAIHMPEWLYYNPVVILLRKQRADHARKLRTMLNFNMHFHIGLSWAYKATPRHGIPASPMCGFK